MLEKKKIKGLQYAIKFSCMENVFPFAFGILPRYSFQINVKFVLENYIFILLLTS